VRKRKAEGAAREAARLASIPEGHDITPPTGTQTEQPTLEHPLNVMKQTENEQFYDTEVEDVDLQLSDFHARNNKEALHDPHEGEVESKRAKTALTIPATGNE